MELELSVVNDGPDIAGFDLADFPRWGHQFSSCKTARSNCSRNAIRLTVYCLLITAAQVGQGIMYKGARNTNNNNRNNARYTTPP